ncbi:hypothetical protein [Paraburkholderia sp. RL18-085-BIA-A]|uniref:hypothetical protein n=1 Tax=Paraburkholderia sp. RL18-085-BIA-A TaxID=3031633 RepID=UPI0038BD3E9E
MPTIQTVHLPKPTDWDEFEKICLMACENRWSPTNLTRHGRPGQAQQGVDVYGNDNLGRLAGIQCKNTVGGVSTKTIDTEIANAEKFSPTLDSLYIATTADTDATIQQYVRAKSAERQKTNKFPIDLLFWGDIARDLGRNQATLQNLYPQFYPTVVTAAATPRDRDIKELTRLLNVVDLVEVERYFDYAPKYVAMAFLEHQHNIDDVVTSPIFHLNDANLSSVLNTWIDALRNLAAMIRRAPYDEALHGMSIRFPMPMDFVQPQDVAAYAELEREMPAFLAMHSNFCKFLRQVYPEVDLIATSSAARSLYTPRPLFG